MPPHLEKYRPMISALNLGPDEQDALLQSLWQTLECLMDHHLGARETGNHDPDIAPKNEQSMVLLFNKNNNEEA